MYLKNRNGPKFSFADQKVRTNKNIEIRYQSDLKVKVAFQDGMYVMV